MDAGEYIALRLGAGRAGGASGDSDDPFPLAQLDEAVIGPRLRGCQHHGRQGSGLAMLPQDRIEITVAHEITVYQDEWTFPSQEPLGLLQTSCRAQDDRLLRVVHLEAETAAIPDHGADRLGVVMQVDHDLGDPEPLQIVEGVGDDRTVEQGQGGLGASLGERAHPLAQTGCQDHRLHDAVRP